MNNICFCIPARYSSTRLDKKLLLKINNETIIMRTINQVKKSKYYNNNIFVFTDSEHIKNEIKDSCRVFISSNKYRNGCERISHNLEMIDTSYKIIVNVQADEPFISSKNIDYCIENHLKYRDKDTFYTTLHEENNSNEYLHSTASLKVITNNNNNVLYYSRNIIPWNKENKLIEYYVYKTFTGIYVFDINMLKLYYNMPDTPLQLMEDCEQLKVLEHGYKINSFPTIEFNEISLNTEDDFNYLKKKYDI